MTTRKRGTQNKTMLEEMAAFFERRLEDYDEHMRNDIVGAREFYPLTASLLPPTDAASVLDLGCGTGLELEEYFRLNPTARVTAIDLSEKMLAALKKKLPRYHLSLLCGSYFDLPLDRARFDAAVSVESLHHFTAEEKRPLYEKVYAALKGNGYFILTDYFAPSDTEERLYRDTLARLKREEGAPDGRLYHYDTPLTVAHETEALLAAGFAAVEEVAVFENTHVLRATK